MRRHGILLAGLLAACGSADRAATLAVTRDSAGIRIVENPAPTEGAPDAVTLSAEPTLVLGELDGPAMEQFGSVVDARLFDGGVAILDGRNRQIRVFAYDGVHRRTFGAEGEGPGDMRGPRRLLGPGGDSLWLWDGILRRVTTFDAAGRATSVVTIARGPVIQLGGMRVGLTPEVIARYADGRFLGRVMRGRVNSPTGVYMDSVLMWRIDQEGRLDSLETLYSHQDWEYDFPGRVLWFDSLAFAPKAVDLASDRAWVRIEGREFQVEERARSGELHRLLRVHRRRRPVTTADRDAFRERELAATKRDDREDFRVIYDWMQYPDSMPAYDQLAVDRTGVIWARVFPDTLATATWDLFAPDGKLLGTAHLPSDLVVRDIDADHLLAQRKGDMDEPLVLLYRLTRRSGP